jgi:hypothetical protein
MLRQAGWFALQGALVIGCVWLWAEDTSADRPSLGIVLTLGGILAFVATIIPVAIIEGVKDVRRLYLPALRRWRARRRDAASLRVVAAHPEPDEPADDLRRPLPLPLSRKLPE